MRRYFLWPPSAHSHDHKGVSLPLNADYGGDMSR